MKQKINIASVIITYNRIEEAKAQMEIIRELWRPLFASIDIYHEYNGKMKWYPKKYKEDFLHRHKQMSHFVGANYLLNQGIKHVLESNKKYDFIIASSADTWFYNTVKLINLISRCMRKKYQLATSMWGIMILGTEFFIITPELAKKIFPLKLTQFFGKYRILQWAHTKLAIFESIFTLQVMRALKSPNKIYLIPGRRTVLPTNRFYSPHFYASHHDPVKRKKDILPHMLKILGGRLENMPNLNKFLN